MHHELKQFFIKNNIYILFAVWNISLTLINCCTIAAADNISRINYM